MTSTDGTPELARLDDLAGAIARVAAALEEHQRFEGPDRARLRSTWRARLERSLPHRGVGADAVLDEIAEVVVAHGLRLGAPGFCGWVTTQATVVPTVAQLSGAVAAAQRWWVHPGNFLERLALRWLAELFGFGPGHGGALASGGAVANLLGLGAARQHAGERIGVDVSAHGVAAVPEPRVYASDHVHHVVLRALGTLGIGRRGLCRVPTDVWQRIRLGELERLIDADRAVGRTPVAVVASAGDVNTGGIDPIDEMRAIAHERNIWIHVDGAYGGFAVVDERVRDRFGDLGSVDSFVADPHKWLAVPVGCGAVLVRDAAVLERAFALEPASYVPHQRSMADDPASSFDELGEGRPDQSLDHSAPPRGLWVWAALREIGVEGLERRVRRHLDCARRVAERVAETEELELLSEPVLSICCFRYHPPAIRDTATLERLNRDVLSGVRARGRIVPSATRINNKLAIRPCFIGPRSGLEDADALIDEVLAVGRELTALDDDRA